MGKIRRVRTKRHIEAVKAKSEGNDTNFAPNQSELPALFPVNNLFKITEEAQDQFDKTVQDAENNPQAQDEKLKSHTKKDRRKMRHEKFLKKLHASKTIEDNEKKAKKRQKTVITGDLNPLTAALLDIDKLSSLNTTNKKKRRNNKKTQSKKPSTGCSNEKKRQKAQVSDMEAFQQVLAHPAFKSNPLATIDEHVRNVLKNECSQT